MCNFPFFEEQFATAVEEFQACLDLQMKHLEPDDRLIAETYPLFPSWSSLHDIQLHLVIFRHVIFL